MTIRHVIEGAVVGGVHAKYLTPHGATLLTAFLGMLYVLVRTFEQLAQAFVLGVWPFHILVIWSVFRFRRSRPDADRPYRVFGYPIVPGIFLAASMAMVRHVCRKVFLLPAGWSKPVPEW